MLVYQRVSRGPTYESHAISRVSCEQCRPGETVSSNEKIPVRNCTGSSCPSTPCLELDFVGEVGEIFDDWRFLEKQQKCKKRQQLIWGWVKTLVPSEPQNCW